eukprot:9470614-Prorocentrum_lima.AAC.1
MEKEAAMATVEAAAKFLQFDMKCATALCTYPDEKAFQDGAEDGDSKCRSPRGVVRSSSVT